MARHTFGGGMADWAFTFNTDSSVSQAGGAVLTFWDSLAGGNQYPAAPLPGGVDDGTGLLDNTGVPISQVTCDGNGEIPDAISGPDGVYKMAADGSGTGSGPRRWITANDMGDDLLALLTDVAGVPALNVLQQYVYYNAALAGYPVRPDTSNPVWWVGPVAPPVGGTGALEALGDVWLATVGGPAPGGVTLVEAGDASIAVGGTSGAPAIETGTLDEIATLHPPAGNWSNNGKQINHTEAGTASDDVAVVSQLPPNAILAPTSVKTGAYTAAPQDFVLISASAAVPITLPTAPADKTRIGAKLIAVTGSNAATITAGGSDKFNVTGGNTTLTLSRVNQTVTLQYQSATSLWLVTGTDPALAIDTTLADIEPTLVTPQVGATGKVADGGHGHFSSGMLARAPNVYAPGTAANLTTTSATFAAVSSGNIGTGSFTAPASGSVMITVSLVAKNSASGVVAFALAVNGTVTPLVCPITQFNLAANPTPLNMIFVVTGLTPGNSYNFDVLFATLGATTLTVTAANYTTTTIVSGNSSSPAVVTTEAI